MNRIGSLAGILVMTAAVPFAALSAAEEPAKGPYGVARETSDRIQKDFTAFRTLLGEARKDVQSQPESPEGAAAPPEAASPAGRGKAESVEAEETAESPTGLDAGFSTLSGDIGRLSETYTKAGIEAPYIVTLVQLTADMGQHLDQFHKAASPTSARAQLKKMDSILVTMEMTHKDHRRWLGTRTGGEGDGSGTGPAIVIGTEKTEKKD